VDYHEIYVVVTANPDGRQYIEEQGCYQRKNLDTDNGGDQCAACYPAEQGIDLNRNNPYRWGGAGTRVCDETYQGASAASEPETIYLNDLVRSLLPDQRPDDDSTPAPDATTGLLISLHSYGPLVLWPWGWTYGGAPNEAELRTLGRKFAYLNGYIPQQASDLYPTTGDTTDWAYGELGIPAYTFELGNSFFEPCVNLPQIQRENLAALLYAAKVARTPYQTPAGPDALNVSVLPKVAPPESPVRVTAVVDDARYRGPEPVQPVVAALYSVDVPPWITTAVPISGTMAPMDGHFDSVQESVQATLDTAGLENGRHILFVRGQDADGNWGAPSAAFFSVGTPIYMPIVVKDGPTPSQ
jgi:carboxypeptidase T